MFARPTLLGAHVSTAGGIHLAPERGARIDANVIQIFTKQVNRWAEPEIEPDIAAAFREAVRVHGIKVAGSHDSYLINLASPDSKLRSRSQQSFRRELERCRALELDFLVTHPGNATDGNRVAGLRRNAGAISRTLDEVDGGTAVLLEATAGQGTSLAHRFEELADLLELVGAQHQARLGVCLDTAHLFAAGHDLVDDYDGVMSELERIVGLARIGLFHLNDSKTACGSRVDRHEHIGRGTLGSLPFRRLMHDSRFVDIPKLIETPKGDDPDGADRRNLQRLRRYRPVVSRRA
ncbi:MAG: deoxyribonuclease IV [Gemmatimonadota bacterium]|nr:MAG: deoxyribonuclease IV [Gemmatimonadota bacterium]